MEKSGNVTSNHQLYRLITSIVLVALFVVLTIGRSEARDTSDIESSQNLPAVYPDITVDLEAAGSCNSPSCNSYGSPVAVDITGDGKLEVIATAANGYVTAVKHDGTILWQVDTAPMFGMAAGTQEIHSSPAVADIDNDGFAEIVFGTGTIFPTTCTQGGVAVLNHLGQLEPGWPQFAADDYIPPVGCADTVFSTPSLGDVDNDGDLEIVSAGFDKRVNMWHHDGTLQPGYPINSHFYSILGWPNLVGQLADTVWGSPALADMNGDGNLEVILGTDEGMFNIVDPTWTCDAVQTASNVYCGGSIYVVDKSGVLLPGWPKYIHEIVQSAPIVADLNGDNLPEIIVGTGTFYYNLSGQTSKEGYRLHVLQADGTYLPGWDTATTGQDGGKQLNGTLPSAPALGDLDGDGVKEIVAIDHNANLHAFKANGTLVSGFPMTPTKNGGGSQDYTTAGNGVTMADYDSDGDMEIFVNVGSAIGIVDGDGSMLSKSPGVNGNNYLKERFAMTPPTIADLDADGHLDFVTANTNLQIWKRTTTGSEADWGTFRGSPSRAGSRFVPEAVASISQSLASTFFDATVSPSLPVNTTIALQTSYADSFDWAVSSSDSRVTVTPASGTTTNSSKTLNISINTAGLGTGNHTLTSLVIDVTMTPQGGGALKTEKFTVPMQLTGGQMSKIFLPLLSE